MERSVFVMGAIINAGLVVCALVTSRSGALQLSKQYLPIWWQSLHALLAALQEVQRFEVSKAAFRSKLGHTNRTEKFSNSYVEG